MRQALIVFIGGALGSLLRALLISTLSPVQGAGYSTFVLLANVSGASLLGCIYALANEAGLIGNDTRLFIATGVLGGYTTFSTFALGADTLLAGPDPALLLGLAYVALSVALGPLAVALGMRGTRALIRITTVRRDEPS